MAFGLSAAAIAGISAAAAAVTAGVTLYNGVQQAKAANKANDQAKANALKAQQDADQANNRANAKRPDTQAILDAATMAGKAGEGGTLLTGPGGIDPNALNLGKNTLLGG